MNAKKPMSKTTPTPSTLRPKEMDEGTNWGLLLGLMFPLWLPIAWFIVISTFVCVLEMARSIVYCTKYCVCLCTRGTVHLFCNLKIVSTPTVWPTVTEVELPDSELTDLRPHLPVAVVIVPNHKTLHEPMPESSAAAITTAHSVF